MEHPALGRYVIESELGRGAMGVVYKATDPMLERALAIKTINMDSGGEGSKHYETRFYQEARAAAGLNHPNIVTIYDVGKSGDVAYMAMEFIAGVELRVLLEFGQPLSPARALSIAAQVAEGLAYAHEHGVVHRDIKPANIMVVADGPVKITDFGLARKRVSADMTLSGSVLGSPRYMSPEQALGKRADHRSDIFSLGVVLYEMLTGVAPFGGENEFVLAQQIMNFAPPAPSAVISEVPKGVDHVVARMIAKLPDERYQSARELARDLAQCVQQFHLTEGAMPTQPPPARAISADARPAVVDLAKTVALEPSGERTRRSDG